VALHIQQELATIFQRYVSFSKKEYLDLVPAFLRRLYETNFRATNGAF
jgi:hypothetical protein